METGVVKLLGRTKNFIILRLLVGVAVIVGGIILVAIMVALMNAAPDAGLFILIGFALFGRIGYHILARALLYAIRVGHTAAITQIMRDGQSDSEGMSIGATIVWSKDIIVKYLGSAVGSAAVGIIITGAVKQVMKWVNRGLNLLSWIPGMDKVQKFVNMMITVLCSAIDCSILSYIIWHEDERNAFKKGCDGLVLFAQAWKGMLKGALKVVAVIYGVQLLSGLVGYGLAVPIIRTFGAGAGLAAIFGALLLMVVVSLTLTQPFTMVSMLKSYHKSIAGLEPSVDIHGKLSKFSSKFRKLEENANVVEAEPVAV